ncbi:MAG TPA: hypothetical protein VIJ34_00140 [Acidimicrobiales bacterium]
MGIPFFKSTPPEDQTPDYWVTAAKGVLDSVIHAVEDFRSAPDKPRQYTALRNFLENARSVTWTLEHLKASFAQRDEWQEWWDSVTSEVRTNAVARWFYQLRNPVIKEGASPKLLVGHEFLGPFPPPGAQPPEGAKAYRPDIGKGWWLMEDGSFLPAPPAPYRTWMTIQDAPEEYRATPLEDLMAEYIAVLERLIATVSSRFIEGLDKS